MTLLIKVNLLLLCFRVRQFNIVVLLTSAMQYFVKHNTIKTYFRRKFKFYRHSPLSVQSFNVYYVSGFYDTLHLLIMTAVRCCTFRLYRKIRPQGVIYISGVLILAILARAHDKLGESSVSGKVSPSEELEGRQTHKQTSNKARVINHAG